MKTKDIVWKFFNNTLLKLAKKDMKEVNFQQLMTLIRSVAKVYDNRTAKNYIDCMMDNNWIISNEENPFDIVGRFVVTSVYKYKYTTWTINENPEYESVSTEEILEEILKNAKE